MTENTHLQSCIAHASEDATTVHGVAIGEDDVTRGKHGLKRWPRDTLEPAATSLEGESVYHNYSDPSEHNGDGREPIGEVVRAAYEEGVGVVYEAELEDEEVAKQLSRGELEVSIEGSAPKSEEDEETGAAILQNFSFSGIAVVERGASPSNYSAPGGADTNPGIAALSAGAIEEALGGGDDPEPDDPETGEVSGSDETIGAESPAETDSHMSESTTDTDEPEESGPDVEALLQRVDEKEERIESLEAELEEKKEQIQEVAEAYAAALATEDSPFTAEEYAEKFEVAELREKYEEREVELAEPAEPDIQSGGGETNPEETAELSADDTDRIEQIDTKLSMLSHSLPESRKAELREEACELAGTDDYEAALKKVN